MHSRTILTYASRMFIRGAFVLSFLVLLLTGCSSDQEYTVLSFVYPTVDEKHYVEEGATRDSVIFVTSDSYEVKSEASWIEVTTNAKYDGIVNDGYSEYLVKSLLTIKEDNPTDAERVGIVTVTTAHGSIAVGFYQKPKSAE